MLKYFQENNQQLELKLKKKLETVMKDIEENMKPIIHSMEEVIILIKDYFFKNRL